MPEPDQQIHLNLDEAWPTDLMPTADLRQWGPRLRYHGQRDQVNAFYREIEPRLAKFVLYGSGDYHYLAGVLLRRVKTPVVVVSFDNHPDWDIRPPYWACGGWVNRALDMPMVQQVSVWGCGNFELALPARLFANRKALRNGTLQVYAWAERQTPSVQRRFNCMTRENWQGRFEEFAHSLAGHDLYVTVDLDCLREEEAVTNWENGLFTANDLALALSALRAQANVVAGDLCGAYSKPTYSRWFQSLAGNWDHPKLAQVDENEARRINTATLNTIWPVLAGSDAARSCKKAL